ncbi:hypothetical protein EJB05_01070, partial [Eragrostis curvula]
MPGAARSPAESGGKFWSEASESESEAEDLGCADPVPMQATHLPLPEVRVAEEEWQTVKKKPHRSKELSMRASEVVKPWRKLKSWKGPLPKARVSLRKTLGDVIMPALEQLPAGVTSSAAGRSRGQSDPKSSLIQNLNRLRNGPIGSGPGPSRVHVRHRKNSPETQQGSRHPTRSQSGNPDPRNRRPSYLQAAMAGGGVKGSVGGAGGDGGGDRRRGYGQQGFRGNRFKPSRGRGRSPSPPRRDDGRVADVGGRGGRGPSSGRGRGRGNWDGNPGTNSGRGGVEREAHVRADDRDGHLEEERPQLAGKHRGPEQAGENAKKKKKFQLQCTICLEEHHTSKCGLLLGPKPSAVCCGFGGKGEVFFQIPYDKAAPIPKKVTATALVTIVEGEVSAELVKAELVRLIPVKWDWVVRPHGNGKYLVTFPCQVELQRMVAIKRIPTDNNEGVMAFEEWSQEIKPAKKLQKVWVHVYGVPYEIRSFLPLWAVATVIGATTCVDMKYTRKAGVVRIQVAVLDVDNIPDSVDIVVDDALYEIFFNVDYVRPIGDDNNDDEEDDLDDDEGDQHGNEKKGEDHVMEEADNLGHGSDDTANPGQLNTMASGPSGTKPTEEEDRIINKAIDIAVEELLIECAKKIIAEEADFSGEGMAVFAGVEHAPPPMSEVCSDLNGDGGGGHGAGGGRAKLQPPPAVRTAPLPTDLSALLWG